jgi:predicted ribosome quality control (RQC) complex YloA/Tae2 family protein
MDISFEQEKKRTYKAVKKRLKRIEKGILQKEKALEESLDWQKVSHYGDLLKANFSKIIPGLKDITVLDWLQENKPVTIILDPLLTPKNQLERFFKKSKKLKKAHAPLQKAIDYLKGELAKWLEIQALIENFKTIDELYAFQLNYQLLQKAAPQVQVKAKEAKKSFHTFFSQSHLPILVGKSAHDNEQLTFQVANGDDLWLHVSGKAGSHVVIKKKKSDAIDQEAILDAATLALYFSKARSEPFGQHEVVVTQRRFVQRIKGAPKGKVGISSYKTLNLTLDPLRIEAIKKRKN